VQGGKRRPIPFNAGVAHACSGCDNAATVIDWIAGWLEGTATRNNCEPTEKLIADGPLMVASPTCRLHGR